jgi:hypothetical protein
MKARVLLVVVLFVALAVGETLAPTQTIITFEKVFSNGEGYSVVETKDGGYVIVGYTYGAGKWDVYLIKTDSNGNKIWERTFGGKEDDVGYSVIETKDGCYVIAGYTESFGMGSQDVYLIKTDSEGNKIWEKTFGGRDKDCGYSLCGTKDGGYIIAGYTYSFGEGGYDVYLLKVDSNGNKIWEKTFGGGDDDWGYSVFGTKDGGYIISGWTESFGANMADVYLIKTDSKGKKIWERIYGGWGNDVGRSVIETKDGGYLITGWIGSFGVRDGSIYLLKIDSKGNKMWEKTPGVGASKGNSVIQTKDGGFIIAGNKSLYADIYLYIIKTDAKGNRIWDKTFMVGSISAPSEGGNSIFAAKDGGYVITGRAWNNVYLLKTNSKGDVKK